MIKLMPQILLQICILCNTAAPLFGRHYICFDFIDAGSIMGFGIGLLDNVANSPCRGKKHTSIHNLGCHELYNYDIIMESSLPQASKFGSPNYGPVARRGLIFPFPFK
ncbi:hypothetical protein Dimus_022490 [Dionaea muscipula]